MHRYFSAKFVFFHIIAAGDVLYRSSGHKDALETDGLPSGKACVCPSRSVTKNQFQEAPPHYNIRFKIQLHIPTTENVYTWV